MFKPGKTAAVKIFNEERAKFSVSPRWLSFDVLKSGALMVDGFLQGKPLMKMVCFSGSVVAVGQVSWRLPQSAKQVLVQENVRNREKITKKSDESILYCFSFVVNLVFSGYNDN